MRSAFLIGLLPALFATAPVASAQTQELSSERGCLAAWDKREHSPVKGIFPTVSVMRSGSRTRDCDVITIYFRWSNWDRDYPAVTAGTKGGTAYHFARLTEMRNGATSEQWADSRSCPALAGAIASLAKLTPPPISIPGHVPLSDKPDSIQLDGDNFSLANSLGPEFGGNQASPLGQWTYTTLIEIESCWTTTAPSFG
jgi:hypothetical protein